MVPEMEERILSLIRRGLSQARVVELLDIDESTLRKHCDIHPDFSYRLQQARVEQEAALVEKVINGDKGDRGAMWLLGKQHPDRYGRKVDEAPPVTQPVEISFVRKRKKRAPDQSQAGEALPGTTPAPAAQDAV